jgi:phenylacetic acid degradation operon negative regulatory protein
MPQSCNAIAPTADQLFDRPLSARSVMASLLLGRHPARARGRELVRWCGLFGIAPGTSRVALHRMTTAGELRRDGDAFELVGALARRQTEQEVALARVSGPWDGGWRMAVVVGPSRSAAVRADMRVELRRARLAEWREGVWLRPDNVPVIEDPRATWLNARPRADSVGLARELFAPQRWDAEARRLAKHLDGATADLGRRGSDAIAPAFVAGAAALRHIRSDPLLPAELLPDGWGGDTLRARYETYREEFNVTAREWFQRAA